MCWIQGFGLTGLWDLGFRCVSSQDMYSIEDVAQLIKDSVPSSQSTLREPISHSTLRDLNNCQSHFDVLFEVVYTISKQIFRILTYSICHE